jgi:hypothetical protein
MTNLPGVPGNARLGTVRRLRDSPKDSHRAPLI